ncbi:hypothetical protein [Photobacterium sanguinicancri]|uniref:Uncharacterized protein n=1 Tax=Photobacterium sanguinicancri TaxID=875932 RepID=A0ABX4G2I3_9GAMM|nr:hypothetical protein [Photobacterium sanguinicancri]OZS45232.1 hypothetical protein ASV53_04275 [Photobacterium sanguinicancri]
MTAQADNELRIEMRSQIWLRIFFEHDYKQLIDIYPFIDASSVRVINKKWVVGSGFGKMLSISQLGKNSASNNPVLWDNYWSVLA